jgi:hypothetical protein
MLRRRELAEDEVEGLDKQLDAADQKFRELDRDRNGVLAGETRGTHHDDTHNIPPRY